MDDTQEDAFRELLTAALAKRGLSEGKLSLHLGRERTYINAYMKKRSPRKMDYDDKVKSLKYVGLKMPAAWARQHDEDEPVAVGGGFSEDAARYVPPAKHYLRADDHTWMYEMRSRALDQHPKRPMPGDVLVVEIVELSQLRTGDIVVLNADLKTEARQVTLVREFVEPGVFITNSTGANSIFRLDDNTKPFDANIAGRVKAINRPFTAEERTNHPEP